MNRSLRNLLLLLASLLFSLVLFELAVGLSGVDLHQRGNWRYHPDFGWTDAPNRSYRHEVAGREVEVSFNRHGFRGEDFTLDRPPGRRRVVVIGDSFSSAIQVSWSDSYLSRLEQLLRADGGDWEVIGLGVSDYGTTQELRVLEELGLALQPEWVIHQVFPLNDVCNNNPALQGLCKSRNDRYRPYPLNAPGEPLRIGSKHPRLKWWRDRLASVFLAEAFWRHMSVERPAYFNENYWPERFREAGFGELDPLLHSYLPAQAQRPDTAPGWPLTERLLEAAVERSRDAGATYLGLVIPFQARTDDAWGSLSALSPELDRDLPERRLQALYGRLGVTGVMMKPIFEAAGDDGVYIEGDGHLNPDGHRLVAERLHAVIDERLQASQRQRDSDPP